MSTQLSSPVYDRIGESYARSRRADPRWQAAIDRALSGQRSLLNVGAGSGSYESDAMNIVAVEPSAEMIRQRPKNSPPAIRAIAEQLPFPAEAFQASMAILTTHHWNDVGQGFAEMRRVSSLQVFVTWDPGLFAEKFWLVRDYLPEIAVHERKLATLDAIVSEAGSCDIQALLVPSDCVDGFLGAFWKRPEAYLSASVRKAMSGLALLDPFTVENAMDQLRADLASGQWSIRNASLQTLDQIDLGYRLVTAHNA